MLPYKANIETAGNALMDVINDILDLSKIESGKLRLIDTKYDIALVINDACALVKKRAMEKNLSFNIHVDRKLPSGLRGDDIRLRQILVNLLTNAVKYTNEGHITLTVNLIGSEDMQAYINFSVKDTGIGIRPDDKDRLFDSFTRLDDEKTRGIEGTGLGLSIVSKLLDMMGSRLELESIYGKGSDFYFDIKQDIVDPEPIGDYLKHVAVNAARSRQGKYIYAPGARILVIDDRPLNLAVVRGFLKNSGIIIDEALSGEEGILLMKKNHYDMIFFDHMMPGEDGVKTYRKCLEEGIISKDLPAVMMTANITDGAKDEYLDMGFSGYISKPVTADELSDIIAGSLPKDMVSFKEYKDPLTLSGEDTLGNDNASSITQSNSLIDIDHALKECMGDRSIYLTVINEFLKEENDLGLKSAFIDKDWEKYRISAHSLKSAAKYAGAKKLHDLAYDCEAALKRGDHAFVEEKHSDLIKLYDETAAFLKTIK